MLLVSTRAGKGAFQCPNAVAELASSLRERVTAWVSFEFHG